MKTKPLVHIALVLLIAAAAGAAVLSRHNDKQDLPIEEEDTGWACSHDPETYKEPTLRNGAYYPDGDKKAAYHFEINGTEFSVSGNIDRLIEDYNIPYRQDDTQSKNAIERADDDDDIWERQLPAYDELKRQLGGKLRTNIFTLHELDDSVLIYVYNGDEKVLSFDYISDGEFAAGDGRFVLRA